jgi:FKBP-type peptidyl-prolyl cis-trans isomerase FklB
MLRTTSLTLAWRGFLIIGLIAAEACAQEVLSLTAGQKESYAIGVDLARNIRRRGVQVDPEALIKGMRDVLANEKLQMTDEELLETLRAFQVDLKQKEFAMRKGSPEADDEPGSAAAFLAQNKAKEGVITLPDGLQYRILRAGSGPKPTETDTVECHFRGTYIDGHEFSDSYRSGKPATLKMSEAAAGLKEALLLMPVGSKWEVVIPPQLIAGENPARLRTQPKKIVIYELELLAIK